MERTASQEAARPPAGLEELSRNWVWMLALGVVWMVLGALAILLPLVAAIAFDIFLGVLFVIGGVTQLLQAVSARGWRGTTLQIVGGALALALGVLLLLFPLEGILTLTVFIAAFFIAEGAVKIALSLQHRDLPNWGWALASGIAGVAVGVLLALGLPGTAFWAVGLLIGAELLLTGWGMISLALSARDASLGAPATGRRL